MQAECPTELATLHVHNAHWPHEMCCVQDELQNMQAQAQYAESRAAVAEAELQSLRKVCNLLVL